MIAPIDFDDLDEAIVSCLQEDGRLSNRAVARELGISESAVRKRLKRLVDSGAISYGLIVDVSATGMDVAGWIVVDALPTKVRKVAAFISSMRHCSMCSITTGDASIRAYIYAANLADLAKTLQSISGREGVNKIEFRETVGYAQHRYEMIMLPDSREERWRIVDGKEKR